MLAAFSWIVITVSVDPLIAWLPISYTNLFVGLVFFILRNILYEFSL